MLKCFLINVIYIIFTNNMAFNNNKDDLNAQIRTVFLDLYSFLHL